MEKTKHIILCSIFKETFYSSGPNIGVRLDPSRAMSSSVTATCWLNSGLASGGPVASSSFWDLLSSSSILFRSSFYSVWLRVTNLEPRNVRGAFGPLCLFCTNAHIFPRQTKKLKDRILFNFFSLLRSAYKSLLSWFILDGVIWKYDRFRLLPASLRSHAANPTHLRLFLNVIFFLYVSLNERDSYMNLIWIAS